MRRITNGQKPDGSGTTLVGSGGSLSDYFYLPGRAGGQVGRGDPTATSGVLSLRAAAEVTTALPGFSLKTTDSAGSVAAVEQVRSNLFGNSGVLYQYDAADGFGAGIGVSNKLITLGRRTATGDADTGSASNNWADAMELNVNLGTFPDQYHGWEEFGAFRLHDGSFITNTAFASAPYTAAMQISSWPNGCVYLILESNSGQTADFMRFVRSGTGTLSYFDKDGVFHGSVAAGFGAGGWTDDGTVVRLTTATDNVSVGTASSLSAKLGVLAAASAIGTVVKYTSGTVDLSQWQDASGNVLFRVSSGGSPTLANGTASPLASRNAAGSGSYSVLYADSSDIINIGSSSTPQIFLNPNGNTTLRARGGAAAANTRGVVIGDASAVPNATLQVKNIDTARVTLRLDSIAAQSANILEAYDTAANKGFYVDGGGQVNFAASLYGGVGATFQIDAAGVGSTFGQITDTVAVKTVFLNIGAMTDGSIITFPGTNATLMGTSTVQNVSGKTFTGTTTINASATNVIKTSATGPLLQDSTTSTKTAGWDMTGQTASTKLTWLTAPILASRSQSYPNDTGTYGLVVAPASATVDLTGKTASVGTTTAFTTVHAGFYRLSAYAVFTAVTVPGNLTITAGWTDPQQAQTLAIANAIAYAAVGNFDQASCVFYSTSGSTITFATTLTGTGTYNFYCRVEALT